MTELWQHEFFRNAVLACVLGGGGLSIIGVFVTLMDIPFLGISMSHSAFLGAIIGLLCGFDPFIGAIVACALSGLIVGPLSDKAGSSSNNALAVIFSATMGLAFLLLARIPGPKSEALNLIWGNILTISRKEITILAVIFSTTVALLVVFFKEISAVLFNREVAAASGIPEKVFYYGVILLAGLLISASLDIVGGLLIFALLVNPAGAARQLTYRLKTMFLFSVLFGIASCFAGLYVSYRFDVPAGAVIVLCSSGIYLIAFAVSAKRQSDVWKLYSHSQKSDRNSSHVDISRREFFNERAGQWLDMWYKDQDNGTYTRYDKEFDRLFSLTALRPGDTILDVGCGSGVMVPYILERIGPSGKLHEVDYAEKMIEVNRSLHTDSRVTFTVSSIDKLKTPEAYFDAAFCFSCFPHFHRKPESLAVLYRALKPNGKLVIAHFDSSEKINDHHSKHKCVMHDHLPNKPEMRLLLSNAGFGIDCFTDEEGFYYIGATKRQPPSIRVKT
ncbi:MAG: metal ABC transporter permease [Lentisphaerae bacterium]|nr:metal ABC transporter permease [Lentisphaerota bacterium]